MKSFIIICFACLTTLMCMGQAQRPKTMETELKKKIALACKLTDKDQIKRMNELHQTLFIPIRVKNSSFVYELLTT